MQRRRRKRVDTRDNPSVLKRATAIQLARRKGRSKPEMAKMFRMSKRQIERYLALPASILPWIDGRVITMAHARVLTDYILAIPAARLTELVAQVRSQCLSAKARHLSHPANRHHRPLPTAQPSWPWPGSPTN